MRKPKGIVLMCSQDSKIVEVLHDDWGLAERGNSMTSMVSEGDQRKCHLFFEAIASEGKVFGWEMHVNGETLSFAGFVSTGPVFVIGSEEPAFMEQLHVDLTEMNSELTNALREAYKHQTLARRMSGPSLEDFAKLTNEITALHREITKRARDLERINRDYERRQAEMSALENRRENFLQHLVHDLRSPLTSVNGAVGLALSGALGPIDKAAREALVLAQEGCNRLTEMISTILDTAKAEAGQLDVQLQGVSVKETVETVERDFRNRAAEANVTLRVDVDENVFYKADRAIVRRVLGNFVVNALKFSPRGKVITIAGTMQANRVRVSVIDEGPGIPAEHVDRLFKKYGQIERRGMSTGLGLAFCKEMITAMGGTVGVDSIEGKGATFWFELPCA